MDGAAAVSQAYEEARWRVRHPEAWHSMQVMAQSRRCRLPEARAAQAAGSLMYWARAAASTTLFLILSFPFCFVFKLLVFFLFLVSCFSV